MTPFPI